MEAKLKLKELRKNMGLTQAQFADKAGFSRSTISEYENGTRKITLDAIQKLAAATGTSTSDWIDEDLNVEIKAFDGLKMVIKALYENGDMDINGKTSDENRKLLHKMLDQELPLFLASLKK
ncbi:helix-turn-helix domain-containing protein [Clostridium beijerinckii]|uniref:helix-turn-helix domain-containing protein n=1 Tax=Clostridium beijerinckii TaxID=1520 RepID=UPI001F385EF8|nr:helix-turn-helix transcriptional regulator [Clostridium beijerinckii]